MFFEAENEKKNARSDSDILFIHFGLCNFTSDCVIFVRIRDVSVIPISGRLPDRGWRRNGSE